MDVKSELFTGVKDELLGSVFDIYSMEIDVTWRTSIVDGRPFSKWDAIDGSLALHGVIFSIVLGRKWGITQAQIWRPDQEIGLRVVRADLDKHFENDSIREDFLEPLQAFVALHDHVKCERFQGRRVHGAALDEHAERQRRAEQATKIGHGSYRVTEKRNKGTGAY
jgi:hypothetical protein